MARLVIVTGDKGGVGKSFLSRSLLDWYAHKGRPITAFDTDKTNSTLFRFYSDYEDNLLSMRQLDTESESELDELLNDLAKSKSDDVVLLDCAARTLDKLLKWMNDVNFFELSNEFNIQITLAFVLAPERDCVAILKDAYLKFSDRLDYVIVKNLGKGTEFKIYDNSNIRRELTLANVMEIELPALLQKTAVTIDELNLPFRVAKGSTAIGLADRQRIITYSKKLTLELDRAENLWR